MADQQSNILRASKTAILDGIDKALADYKVAALTKRGEQGIYNYILNSKEIVLGHMPTVLSPKKFFFPQDEVILEYNNEGKVAPKIEATPLVLFGICPCDLHAIKLLDEAFSESHGDPNYLAKRDKAIIIGMDCKKPCDKDAFCFKVNAHKVTTGFDIMLRDVGDEYLVEIGTAKGEDFFNKYITTTQATQQDVDAFNKEKEQGFSGQTPFKNLDKLPEMFEANKEHPVWEEEGKKCLSCGSCIMVCPTCYCFDVVDEWALNLKEGQRIRRWDACMLSPFAEVAGGENFREKTKNRLHHRINRKFDYLMKKHGQSVCVGCGRCVRACLANISPKTIVEKISGEENK